MWLELTLTLALILICVACWKTCQLPVPGPGIQDFLFRKELRAMARDFRNATTSVRALADIYGEVFRLRTLQGSVIITAVPQDIVQILSHGEYFPRPSNVTKTFENFLPGSYFGEIPTNQHKIVRRRLVGCFNHNSLNVLESEVITFVQNLCEELRLHAKLGSSGDSFSEAIDITTPVAKVTFQILARVAFGSNVSSEQAAKFAKYTTTLVDNVMRDIAIYPLSQVSWILQRLNFWKKKDVVEEIFREIIQKRLENSKEQPIDFGRDYLDNLLDLCNNDIEAVIPAATEFAILGSHTTHNAVAWSLFEACCCPHVMERIESEISTELGKRPLNEPLRFDDVRLLPYLSRVWKETLRLHPIGTGLIRVTTRDITLKGSQLPLPKGTCVLAHTNYAHTNPNFWQAPMTFNPDRWESCGKHKEVVPGSFVPFGLGPKSCGGRFLAEVEGPLILAELHRRFIFTLDCDRGEIMNCSSVADSPRYVDSRGECQELKLPMRVKMRAVA